MASYFWREIFYVPFPGTPGKIPGNSGSTELRKELGTTLNVTHANHDNNINKILDFVRNNKRPAKPVSRWDLKGKIQI